MLSTNKIEKKKTFSCVNLPNPKKFYENKYQMQPDYNIGDSHLSFRDQSSFFVNNNKKLKLIKKKINPLKKNN